MSGCAQYHRGRLALLTDHVLTTGQLLRIGADPYKFPSITDSVRTSNNYFSEREVTFHALQEKTLRRLKGTQLAHLAGVAEMRMELGIGPGSHWKSTGHALNARFKPDALWMLPAGEVRLIEFDSGDYSRGTIHTKLEKFIPQGRVYWGMTSALRMSRWISLYPDVHFILALWWQTPTERRLTLEPLPQDRTAIRNSKALERTWQRYRQTNDTN